MALIDLHCHTSRYSDDAVLAPEDLVAGLIAAGIDGAAITEHNRCWSRAELDELLAATSAAGRLKLWAGQEVRVRGGGRMLGDLLVYGPTAPFHDGTTIEEVLEAARVANGFVVAAHLGAPGNGLGEAAGDYPLDAAEVWNGRYGPRVERASLRQMEALLLPATGGSDAHTPGEVGGGATELAGGIEDFESLSDLGAALRRGDSRPWKPAAADRLRRWWRTLAP